MKIAFMSDTHNCKLLIEEDCDLLIHCGDFSNLGQWNELHQFNQQIFRLKESGRIKKVILVPGNHDLSLDPDRTNQFDAKSVLSEIDHILIHDYLELDGLKIFGTSYVPTYYNWAFMKDEEDLLPLYRQIPSGLDILISHGPPRGILDLNERKEHTGSSSMKELIEGLAPKIHCFGHIHPSRGVRQETWANNSQTIFINCACVDHRYNPLEAFIWD